MANQPSLFPSPALVPAPSDVRALSLIQPWPDAMFDGGKPLENRIKWLHGSKFRGSVYLHASKRSRATRDELIDVTPCPACAGKEGA